ncbi:MAG: hypothetical protein ACUVV6_09680, partial [Thermoplasmatota archaeon]
MEGGDGRASRPVAPAAIVLASESGGPEARRKRRPAGSRVGAEALRWRGHGVEESRDGGAM